MGAAQTDPAIAEAHRRIEAVWRIEAARVIAGLARLSLAEGTDTVDSDLDVLVTFEPGASLFDAVAISEELQDLLGISVDVVSANGLKERDQHIRDTAVPV